MGTRSADERWCSRNEPLHHHRSSECTVTSPLEPAARGPVKMRNLCGTRSQRTDEQTMLALEFTAERAHPKSGRLCTDLNSGLALTV